MRIILNGITEADALVLVRIRTACPPGRKFGRGPVPERKPLPVARPRPSEEWLTE